jgi:hypothetical protein
LIASLIGLAGITLMYHSIIESVILDKKNGTISKGKISIFCQERKSEWAIAQIKNIRVFKRGHDGIQFRNLHYEVQFDFADVPNKVMMKTMNL